MEKCTLTPNPFSTDQMCHETPGSSAPQNTAGHPGQGRKSNGEGRIKAMHVGLSATEGGREKECVCVSAVGVLDQTRP